MRPRIGITSWHYRDDDERWEAVLDAYTKAVLGAGGLPVILPITSGEPTVIEDYLNPIDEDMMDASGILDRCLVGRRVGYGRRVEEDEVCHAPGL